MPSSGNWRGDRQTVLRRGDNRCRGEERLTGTQLDVATTAVRIFTAEEADRLLPAIEELFLRLEEASTHAREFEELLEDLESYWGPVVRELDHPDYASYTSLRAKLGEAGAARGEAMRRFVDLGCELKDPHRGLVDFYAYVSGDLVYLCWQRGEPAIRFYHTLDAGFTGRRPLP